MEAKILLTADELEERASEYPGYELRRGELVQVSPSGSGQGIAGGNVAAILGSFVLERGLGRVITADAGFRISENTVYAPDVAFVRKERLTNLDPTKFFPFAPDLAVEVLSTNDKYLEVQQKIKSYLDAGTPLVWLLDPELKTVAAYEESIQNVRVFTEDNTLEAPNVLPGFSCPVSRLFS